MVEALMEIMLKDFFQCQTYQILGYLPQGGHFEMDTKDLEQSLDALILSLGDNKAAENYYQQVKVKVGNTKRPNDLIRLLEALCSSAKVKDVHGLKQWEGGLRSSHPLTSS